ncbi:hypothetical protein J6590_024428 [Homalodisca vitripennis]|nr:hypothetical protein J6590_024428 [Homalodisca vitripennis]
MNRNSIEDNQVLEELLRCSSDSESDDLFQDDTDNDPDFTTDGLLGDASGSLATFLAKGLPKIATDWSKWKIFFCDERVVPIESSDSNYGLYKNSLIGVVPVKEDQFIKINPHLPAIFIVCPRCSNGQLYCPLTFPPQLGFNFLRYVLAARMATCTGQYRIRPLLVWPVLLDTT